MPSQSTSTTKAAVSVSQMAEMLELSRGRLYELIGKGVFYPPVYGITNRRPFFPQDAQEANLRVRADQIGANGQYVIFYEHRPRQYRRQPHSPTTSRRQNSAAPRQINVTPSLMSGLRSLGMTDVSRPTIEQALAECYPDGTGETDDSTVLRTVYRHLRRARPA